MNDLCNALFSFHAHVKTNFPSNFRRSEFSTADPQTENSSSSTGRTSFAVRLSKTALCGIFGKIQHSSQLLRQPTRSLLLQKVSRSERWSKEVRRLVHTIARLDPIRSTPESSSCSWMENFQSMGDDLLRNICDQPEKHLGESFDSLRWRQIKRRNDLRQRTSRPYGLYNLTLARLL